MPNKLIYIGHIIKYVLSKFQDIVIKNPLELPIIMASK